MNVMRQSEVTGRGRRRCECWRLSARNTKIGIPSLTRKTVVKTDKGSERTQIIERIKPICGLIWESQPNPSVSQFRPVEESRHSDHLPQPLAALLHDLMGDLIRIVATGKPNQGLPVLIAESLYIPVGMA